jgi:hypothetical protein
VSNDTAQAQQGTSGRAFSVSTNDKDDLNAWRTSASSLGFSAITCLACLLFSLGPCHSDSTPIFHRLGYAEAPLYPTPLHSSVVPNRESDRQLCPSLLELDRMGELG